MNRSEIADRLFARFKHLLPPKKPVLQHSQEEMRVIVGFEEIGRFFQKNGRLPIKAPESDILERCLAIRFNIIKEQYAELVAPFDEYGILKQAEQESTAPVPIDPSSLAERIKQRQQRDDSENIFDLTHVRPIEQRRTSAEWIASREPCNDFDRYRPLFEKVKQDIKAGIRKYYFLKTVKDKTVDEGNFYVVDGQMFYVASIGESFPAKSKNVLSDARAYIVYDNGTQNTPLVSSLVRSMYDDESARGVSRNDIGPLFENLPVTGTIYVLRSQSTHPFIQQNKEVIHKIGVTTGKTKTRVANAENDATYLLAGVDIIAEYQLKGIVPHKLENVLHRIFQDAQIDITISDRFGKPVKPKEWFLVSLQTINKAVELIEQGNIEGLTYNPETQQLEYEK